MKENKIIYILYDWSAGVILMSAYEKEKIFAKIGKLAYYEESIDDLHIIEVNIDKVES